jgi:hypothetical protein
MRHTLAIVPVLLSFTAAAAAQPQAQDWKPVEGTLKTRWAKDVDASRPWPEYPRPQLTRQRWINLNGLWDYAITASSDPAPEAWQGKILVPFPVESALSGVGRRVTKDQVLRYRRTFQVPGDWRTDGQRLNIRFGAVDWHATVLVNGTKAGEHKGGYDGFSFDITALVKDGANTLDVVVADPGNSGGQPRGKQWDTPGGIWYTPTTGIWQTVWLEPTPKISIGGLKIDTEAESRTVTVSLTHVIEDLAARAEVRPSERIEVDILKDDKVLATGASTPDRTRGVVFTIPSLELWSPERPTLYSLRVRLVRDGATVDEVGSYFGLRSVSLVNDRGVNRLAVNGVPTFMFGPLDQGFWPDGLYTPPNEEAMKYDIEAVRRMGGNMLRKHVKVESDRFYYLCDQLGMLVWQDMPSPFFKSKENEALPALTDEWKQNFEVELLRMIQDRGNHPSIVMWVPFNEGWGQNDLAWSKKVVDDVKQLDPSRLVNCASGWTDTGNGDVLDIHVYPGPATPPLQPARAAVLGEYGGLGLPTPGHTWVLNDNWGYVSYKNPEELTAAYLHQINQLPLLIAQGLAAAVYTQTTDVEIEVNGWMTYDRAVWKIDPAKVEPATRALQQPPGVVRTVVPRAGQPGVEAGGPWRFVTEKPGDNWFAPDFDASAWRSGPGGFGAQGTPGAVLGTEWNTQEIWLRRSVAVGELDGIPCLSIHHDEDADVYINGELAASLKGYTVGYTLAPIAPKAAELLKPGATVTLAVHCRQTKGGQYIDVGIATLSTAPRPAHPGAQPTR